MLDHENPAYDELCDNMDEYYDYVNGTFEKRCKYWNNIKKIWQNSFWHSWHTRNVSTSYVHTEGSVQDDT